MTPRHPMRQRMAPPPPTTTPTIIPIAGVAIWLFIAAAVAFVGEWMRAAVVLMVLGAAAAVTALRLLWGRRRS